MTTGTIAIVIVLLASSNQAAPVSVNVGQSATAPRSATSSAQRAPAKVAWQSNWRAFIAELSRFLQSGAASGGSLPLAGSAFVGKEIEFEGIMPRGFEGKPDERINVEMEPKRWRFARSSSQRLVLLTRFFRYP